MLPALLGSGSEDQAASLLEDMLNLYSDHERDAGDTLMMAFEAGSWTKVSVASVGLAHVHLQLPFHASISLSSIYSSPV